MALFDCLRKDGWYDYVFTTHVYIEIKVAVVYAGFCVTDLEQHSCHTTSYKGVTGTQMLGCSNLANVTDRVRVHMSDLVESSKSESTCHEFESRSLQLESKSRVFNFQFRVHRLSVKVSVQSEYN